MLWEAEALWQQVEPILPGLSVEVVARVDSTNSQLLSRYRGANRQHQPPTLPGRRATDAQPCLLVAEHQTNGRGRLGRSWQASPMASLTFSLALPLAALDWSGLSLAVGVALADALDPPGAGAPRIGLKWPNDLWLDGRKLGGILIETLAVGDQRMAIIGIGLNVLPMEVVAVNTGYAYLSELDPKLDVPKTLHRVMLPLVKALRGFERGGFAAFRERYSARDVLVGLNVRAGVVEGVAHGVAENGALSLFGALGEQLVSSDEVSVRLDLPGPLTQPGDPC